MEEEKEAKQANLAGIRTLLSSVVKAPESSSKANISAMAAAGTPDSVAAAAQGDAAVAEVAAVKLTSLMKKMQLGAAKGKKSGGR